MRKPIETPIIGLIGGVASGKSAVAKILAELGALVIDADQLGHEILLNQTVRDELVANFGTNILLLDKTIDRRALGQLVFGTDSESLARRTRLESIVHPRIRELASARINAAMAADQPPRAIVLDAPLLIEAGWRPMCQHVLFVDSSDASRMARGISRGWTVGQFRQRELAQMPIPEKRKYATMVIDNNGTLAELQQQVAQFWTTVMEQVAWQSPPAKVE